MPEPHYAVRIQDGTIEVKQAQSSRHTG